MKKGLGTALYIVIAVVIGVIISFYSYAGAEQINVPVNYSTIQAAIDAANNGDVIIVDPNTYYETINFQGKAVTLKSTDPNDPSIVAATIIDGNEQGPVVTFNNGEDVESILSGFTLQKGKTDYGGGIYCESSSPTISNCAISDNSALYGGGIYCEASSPSIINCTISGNSSEVKGGGIYCQDPSQCHPK